MPYEGFLLMISGEITEMWSFFAFRLMISKNYNANILIPPYISKKIRIFLRIFFLNSHPTFAQLYKKFIYLTADRPANKGFFYPRRRIIPAGLYCHINHLNGF